MHTVPAIGDSYTYPFSISQEQVLAFAEITGDINPLHVNPEVASKSEFGGCIAHGVLTLGVLSKIFGTLLYAEGHVLLGVDTRFLAPIKPGVPYTAVVTVAETFLDKCQVVYRTEMFSEEGKPILRGSCRLLNRQFYGGRRANAND